MSEKPINEIFLGVMNTIGQSYGEEKLLLKDYKEKIKQDVRAYFDSIKPKEQPRPLSKGDWVIIYTGLALYLGEKTKFTQGSNIKCKVVLDSKGQERNYSLDTDSFTRIDTLTEEHLKMLDDDRHFYLVSRMNDGIHWEVTENCRIPSSDGGFRIFKQWCWHETKDGVIREAASDVIARRHFDKMGV